MGSTRSRLLDRLYAYTDFAKRRQAPYSPKNYHLGNIKRLLKAMGDPHRSLKLFHIAGTKGKGSTGRFLARFLERDRFKVGFYASPQFLDERDRFWLDGRPITWKKLEANLEFVLNLAASRHLHPTVFDILTATAFLCFAEAKVNYAVVETGLGGRLDSTNVVTPLASIITSIGLDHTDKLGHSLEAIAQEKAGIVKTRKPVFVIDQSREVLKVIRREAEKKQASLKLVRITPRLHSLSIPGFQRKNLALAQAVYESFFSPLSWETVKETALVTLPGRYEKWGSFVFDVAHNPFSMKNLIHTLREDSEIDFSRMTVVFFVLPDKEIEGILRLFPREWPLLFFDLRLPFLPCIEPPLYQTASYRAGRVQVIQNLNEFTEGLDPRRRYLITGSFYLVSYFYKNRRRLQKLLSSRKGLKRLREK